MVVSAASALHFSGVVSVAFAPAAVLFATVVGSRPELIVLMVGSAFVWLCAISVVATVWSILVPLRGMLGLLVLYAVVLQEGSRWATYALYERLMRGLRSIGLHPTRPAALPLGADVMPAAVASGLGAGIMQVLVMYGDVFGGALLPGTIYATTCPALSVFAVDALCSSAFLVLNVLLCVVGWASAYAGGGKPGSWLYLAAIVALHLLASGATLLNSHRFDAVDGCVVALPCLFVTVLMAGALAACAVGCSAPRKSGGGDAPPAQPLA